MKSIANSLGRRKRSKTRLKGAYEASLAQEEDMRKRVETLKQEVLDLQKRSIQYNIIKREVDTNRELYTSLLQRYKEVDVASGVGANNVFVVDRAGLPGGPSSPNLSHALLMSLLFGLGAGLGYGLWPRAFRQQGSIGRTARARLGTHDPRRNSQRQPRRSSRLPIPARHSTRRSAHSAQRCNLRRITACRARSPLRASVPARANL